MKENEDFFLYYFQYSIIIHFCCIIKKNIFFFILEHFIFIFQFIQCNFFKSQNNKKYKLYVKSLIIF